MKNMKEYPIFKHLIQFSNLVDSEGNFLEHVEIEAKKSHDDYHRRNQDSQSSRDAHTDHKNGAYEGGGEEKGYGNNGMKNNNLDTSYP